MKKRNILYIFVILLSLLQCCVLLINDENKNMKDINEKELNSISTSKIAKNIKDIKSDFSNYKTLTILSYNKSDDGSWKLKCSLKGTKEEVLKDIEKFNYYEIKDYNISYEKENVLIEANLTYKYWYNIVYININNCIYLWILIKYFCYVINKVMVMTI